MPIGADGLGNSLFVDLRDGERRGCVMEWLKGEAVTRPPVWNGVADMLADLAHGLVADVAGVHWRGRRVAAVQAEGGYLSWT